MVSFAISSIAFGILISRGALRNRTVLFCLCLGLVPAYFIHTGLVSAIADGMGEYGEYAGGFAMMLGIPLYFLLYWGINEIVIKRGNSGYIEFYVDIILLALCYPLQVSIMKFILHVVGG